MWDKVFEALTVGFANLTWQSAVLIVVGGVLLYLAIAKSIEPLLLVPIGFGVILGNLPMSGLSASDEGGVINILYNAGILTEIFPALIFLGLGAMIDFGPMLANPTVLIFGAAGKIGIFLVLLLALGLGSAIPSLGWGPAEASSIAVIGAMDGPTAIFVTSRYARHLLPAVSIAAYSYMSLVPILQPPIMRALTTKKERGIVMAYGEKKVSKKVRILFPVIAGTIAMLIAPMGAPLMGMLMLGNLLKESGVVARLAEVSSGALMNVVTLLLGLNIGAAMLGGNFLQWSTILVFVLGLLAISLDTVTGVLLGKVMRIISRGKINPLIGAAGTSAFPMSSRVVQKEGLKANPKCFLLWHAIGANTGGQIGSVMAASVLLALLAGMGIMPS
jgi:oxaloacetate decarboxylase beta subunit